MDPDPLIGKRFGSYEVHERIGAGGMGIVYRAYDVTLDRHVALKVLSPALSNDPKFEQRFLREARAVAKLDHPNIVQVYAAARVQTNLFMAMQFVEGQTLERILEQRQFIPAEETLEIARQVAEALKAAHEQNLIHRDIKPSNIMVEPGGRVRLMDFGLARSFQSETRLTNTDTYLGTPEYSSPEQCVTADLDARTDIYSLGVVLYRMLTGCTPHAAETPMALFRKILDEDPLPARQLNPKIPEPVAQLVSRMMKRDRDRRVQTAGEVASECRTLLSRLKVDAAMSRRTRRAYQTPVLSSGLFAIVTATAVVVGILLMLWLGRNPAQPEPQPSSVYTPPASNPPPQPPHTLTNPAAVTEPVSLIILDFRNGTTSAEHAWMEMGLADLLGRTLLQSPGLRVHARADLVRLLRQAGLGSSVSEEVLPAVAKHHPFLFYLSGTFYVVADQVRLFVELHNVKDSSSQSDSGQFERSMDEFFPLLDEVATWVRQKAVTLSGGSPASAEPGDLGLLSSANRAAEILPAPLLAMAMKREERDGDDKVEASAAMSAEAGAARLNAASPMSGEPKGSIERRNTIPQEESPESKMEKKGRADLAQSVDKESPAPGSPGISPMRENEALSAPGGGFESGKAAPITPSTSAFELARLWYAPQQKLERDNMDTKTLSDIFLAIRNAPDPVRLLRLLCHSLDRLTGEAVLKAWMDYLCPGGCGGLQDRAGKCPACGQELVANPNLDKIESWAENQ